jgi:hypothetical protein
MHLLNTSGHGFFPMLEDHLGATPAQLRTFSRDMHLNVVEKLALNDIKYADLRSALTPDRKCKQIALVFDSRGGGGSYGYEISKSWLPALRDHGPEKTAILHGDLLHLPYEIVHAEFERHLVGSKIFPRLSPEIYYIVYFTNLTENQIRNMVQAVEEQEDAYLGYIDCSTWKPIKRSMALPQYALKHKKKLIMGESEGYTNQLGYPVEDYGFTTVGVEEIHYDLLLRFRLDMGIPEWASSDSDFSLNVLQSSKTPMRDLEIYIDEKRVHYLHEQHLAALKSAGVSGLTAKGIAQRIKEKISRGTIYNLRFAEGTKDGNFEPKNDAYLFTLLLEERPQAEGEINLLTIGMKYVPANHTAEIVTMV